MAACPNCDGSVPQNDDRFRPYCSEACKLEFLNHVGSPETRRPRFRGIAISGKQGAGKTTLIKAIQAVLGHHGYVHQVVSFAEPVKSLSKAVLVELGLVPQGAAEDAWKYKYRTIPQLVGNHLRGYDMDIWVNLAAARIAGIPSDTIPLNDDFRFPNEARALSEQDMFLVRLEVSRELRLQRLSELKNEQHPSEVSLDSWDGFHLTIHQDHEHAVALPEHYAYQILQMAGFPLKPTAQAVLP